MAFAELKIFSESLGMQTSICVIIPQRSINGEIGTSFFKTDRKYKTLYLLHGLSDDNTIWERRTSIERYAQEYGICVVMPNAEKSFYTDMKHGLNYYTYIAKELPAIIQDLFGVSDKREDNFIAGLSMGGYGALKIGMRECDKFCAAAAFSAVADIRNRIETFPEQFKNVFGESLDIADADDLFALAEKCSKNSEKPRIFMGVGTDDFLYEDNVKLKKHFEGLDIDFTYRESEGAHNWNFWDEYIQYALKWMFN